MPRVDQPRRNSKRFGIDPVRSEAEGAGVEARDIGRDQLAFRRGQRRTGPHHAIDMGQQRSGMGGKAAEQIREARGVGQRRQKGHRERLRGWKRPT